MKTAVEWLYEKVWKDMNFSISSSILDQAKEMEKEQIITAYNRKVPFKFGKEYYNETFNNED